MRMPRIVVGTSLGIASLVFGCTLGMLASLPSSRFRMLYAMLLVQTVAGVALAGLWRFLARLPFGGALALEAASVTAECAGVLAVFGWPSDPVIVPTFALWLVLVASLGAVLRRARGRSRVLCAAAGFFGPFAAGFCFGIVWAVVAEGALSVEASLLAALALCIAAIAAGIAVRAVRSRCGECREGEEQPGIARDSGGGESAGCAPDEGTGPAGGGVGLAVDGDYGTDPTDFDIACADLAQAFGLSPRETEVFALLARGYRVPHIAQELGTAEATARSHVQHIYRKMSVCTADQVIRMVECRTAAVHEARCRAYAERIRHIDLLLRLRGDTRWSAGRQNDC